jgi:non-homologous end joining protein Ku
MAVSIWNGTVAFGDVVVPVTLFSAVPSTASTSTTFGSARAVESCIAASARSQGGRCRLSGSARDIRRVVDISRDRPAHFNHPYFLLPDSESQGVTRAYRLLRDAMASTDLVAVVSCCAPPSTW